MNIKYLEIIFLFILHLLEVKYVVNISIHEHDNSKMSIPSRIDLNCSVALVKQLWKFCEVHDTRYFWMKSRIVN